MTEKNESGWALCALPAPIFSNFKRGQPSVRGISTDRIYLEARRSRSISSAFICGLIGVCQAKRKNSLYADGSGCS